MLVRSGILTMEEVNLDPTFTSRKTSSSAISAVGSDYEIESIFGVGGSEPYVNFYTIALLRLPTLIFLTKCYPFF